MTIASVNRHTFPYVWIEVEDEGSSWDGVITCKPTRGLAVIAALSGVVGSEILHDIGHVVVYARIDYHRDGRPAESIACPPPDLPEEILALRQSRN